MSEHREHACPRPTQVHELCRPGHEPGLQFHMLTCTELEDALLNHGVGHFEAYRSPVPPLPLTVSDCQSLRSPFDPHQFAATQCGPCHVLLMFDIRRHADFGELSEGS